MEPDYLIDRIEVERRAGLTRSTIYAGMRAGTFPLAVKVGAKGVRWKSSDITKWIEALPLATGRLS